MGHVVLALAWLGFVPSLETPWKCGETYSVTQGHGEFSHLPNNRNYWAWDFNMAVGDEIWSASDGTVAKMQMDNEIGGCHESYGPYANYILIDHGDGSGALYVHLQGKSSPLKIGDEVQAGDFIGRAGETGWVCGAHLHFQVQEMCSDSWVCESVKAEFKDYGDPRKYDEFVSTNCPATVEPAVCNAVLDGTPTIISENNTGCFERTDIHWWSSSFGDDGHHFYTYASSSPVPECTGTWNFSVTLPGEYRVEAFIPEDHATAQKATYEIHHAGEVARVPVDQATQKGWVDLGVYFFDGSGAERVVLADNTGEDPNALRILAFDTVRIMPVAVDLPADAIGSDGDAPLAQGACAVTGTTPPDAIFGVLFLLGLIAHRRRDDA